MVLDPQEIKFLDIKDMLLFIGVLLFLIFLTLAVVAAFLAAFYAQRAYNHMPSSNDEKKDLLIIAILDWIIFGILVVVLIIFIVVLIIVFVGKIEPSPLLFIGLVALFGGVSILTAWYLIFITIQLATSIGPALKESKKNIGYSTVTSLAAGLFSILAVICLIALSKHVDGRRYEEVGYNPDGSTITEYTNYATRY